MKRNENYQRNLNRLRGFTDGAGTRAMQPQYQGDKDYERGYSDGRKASHSYAAESAKELGVEIREIVPMP